eukprot:364902-Chlamydomonas_euryale.AAC.18
MTQEHVLRHESKEVSGSTPILRASNMGNVACNQSARLQVQHAASLTSCSSLLPTSQPDRCLSGCKLVWPWSCMHQHRCTPRRTRTGRGLHAALPGSPQQSAVHRPTVARARAGRHAGQNEAITRNGVAHLYQRSAAIYVAFRHPFTHQNTAGRSIGTIDMHASHNIPLEMLQQ